MAGAVILDDNAGIHSVLTGLSYAFSLSKHDRHGELVFFDTDTMDHGRRNLELLETLRHSVLNGCRGFYLNYQPIVSVEDETIIGMEALLRWKNDRFGEVPPGFFIRWLENDACFYELGNWILERALTEGKPIIEKWKDFLINVNIAYPQMERVGFIEALSSILEKAEFPPENLCIELTERCRTLEQNFLTQQIKQIKDMGIKVALDDFGTGFSSLDVLSYLPVDTLKIDRGFVAGISEKVANQVIVRSVAQCANELGVKVCVEGIEDRELADFLKPYGPGSYQGYYFSRPISIEKLKEKYMK
ncbi:MAG: EAL domain-containing protein [Lachnospiraceae bacterium]